MLDEYTHTLYGSYFIKHNRDDEPPDCLGSYLAYLPGGKLSVQVEVIVTL